MAMPVYETRIERRSDSGAPRFSVHFIDESGYGVTADCLFAEGEEPTHDEIVRMARRRIEAIIQDRPFSPPQTHTDAAGGLSRSPEETEERTHTSEGRDRGTP
jgi:hypothetical protein